MRRTARLAVAGALAAALVGTAAPAASAAGDCAVGYTCVWRDLGYTGKWMGSAHSWVSFWGDLAFNDQVTSAAANGARCRHTEFHEHADMSTGYPSGDRFRLNSATLVGHSHRDPDLRNGAGDRPGENWNDRVSGFVFVGC